MIGVVLAAGRGSRLDGSTDAMPKCLTCIGGMSLLERTLRALRGAGAANIHIVVGYRHEVIRSQFPGLTYLVNDRWAESNMVESLLMAHDAVSEEHALVIYGDVFVDQSALAAFASRTRGKGLAVASLRNWQEHWYQRYEDPLVDLESFRVDHRGYLREIGRRVTDPATVDGQYMGILSIGPEGWRALATAAASLPPSAKARISMTELLDRVINHSHLPVFVSEYSGDWAEIDTPADLQYYLAVLDGGRS